MPRGEDERLIRVSRFTAAVEFTVLLLVAKIIYENLEKVDPMDCIRESPLLKKFIKDTLKYTLHNSGFVVGPFFNEVCLS